MSKDKGGKNVKKAPADKSAGKTKVVSDYKAESKKGYGQPAPLTATTPKPGGKGDGGKKSK